MTVRRVVTGLNADGKSTFLSDTEPPRTHYYDNLPGHMTSIAWKTGTSSTAADPTVDITQVLPGPGESTLFLVTFPPPSAAAGIDPVAFRAEQTAATPGLTDHFEEGSQFHATPTIDYIVVLSGELYLVLEDGEKLLKPGDIVVQDATGHAWENRADVPATFACVMVPK